MKYIKKPIPIEAIQWTGGNTDEILEFMSDNTPVFYTSGNIIINTLEGKMNAPLGSYIIKGVEGEFYPCKKEVFEATYTRVNEHLITCAQCNKGFSSTNTNIFYDEIDKKYKYLAVCPYCGTRNNWEV